MKAPYTYTKFKLLSKTNWDDRECLIEIYFHQRNTNVVGFNDHMLQELARVANRIDELGMISIVDDLLVM